MNEYRVQYWINVSPIGIKLEERYVVLSLESEGEHSMREEAALKIMKLEGTERRNIKIGDPIEL